VIFRAGVRMSHILIKNQDREEKRVTIVQSGMPIFYLSVGKEGNRKQATRDIEVIGFALRLN